MNGSIISRCFQSQRCKKYYSEFVYNRKEMIYRIFIVRSQCNKDTILCAKIKGTNNCSIFLDNI